MSKIKKSTKEAQNSKESHAPCSQVDALVRCFFLFVFDNSEYLKWFLRLAFVLFVILYIWPRIPESSVYLSAIAIGLLIALWTGE